MGLKSNLLAFFLFLLNYCLFGQKSTIDTTGEVWYYGISYMAPYGDYSMMRKEKDTILMGKKCKVLREIRYRYDSTISDEGIRIIYSDTDKVYYFNFNYNNFFLLYDFSLNPGDTLKIKEPYPTGAFPDTMIKYLVDSVKNVLISGQSLKKMYISEYQTGPTTWSAGLWDFGDYVEHIGCVDIFNYFFPQHELYDCDYSGCKYLRCYFNDSLYISYIEPTSSVPCNYTWVYIEEQIKNKFAHIALKVSNNILTIELREIKRLKYEFEIIDCMGRKMLNDKILTGQKKEYDINFMKSGVYFIKIKNNFSYKIEKIIKI